MTNQVLLSVVNQNLPHIDETFEIINPCTDFGFKLALNNPVILIDFLNQVLNYEESEKIIELEYLDKDLPSLDPQGRDFTVDIVCKTISDRYFLLEMQNDYTSDYTDKAFTEFTRFFSRIDTEKIRQLSTSTEESNNKYRRIGTTEVTVKTFWDKIDEICSILITNKRFNSSYRKKRYINESQAEPQVINNYAIVNTDNLTMVRHYGDLKIKFVIIALANFNKSENALDNDRDRWLYAFKDETMLTGKTKMNAFKTISDISNIATNNALKQFYITLNRNNIHGDSLTRYEAGIYNANKCLQVAIEATRQETRQETIEELAKKLILKGMSISDITEITGLSYEAIVNITSNMNSITT